MGLLDSISAVIRDSIIKQPADKEPVINLTEVPANTDYSYLNDRQNYFDQFEGWTYKAVSVISQAAKSYPPRLIRVQGEEEVEIKDNQILKDLRRFNPFMGLSEGIEFLATHWGLCGSAIWYMFLSDTPGYKMEFYPLDPTRLRIKVDKYGLPDYYEYQGADGKLTLLNNDQLIIFKRPDPRDWMKGYGPLQASQYAHNTMELAAKYNMNVFGNSGRPDGFMVFDGIGVPLKRKIENMLKSRYGGVKNARKIGVLNKTFEWIEMGKTPKDLDFTEGMIQMRDTILSIHGVPKPLVGLTDSTYTNSQEAQRIFQRYTIKPLLMQMECVLNEQLLPKYFRGKVDPSLRFKFDDPVEIDRTAAATESSTLYNAGIISLKDAKLMVGISPEKGDDEVYKTQPSAAGASQADTNTNANPKEDNKKEAKELLTLQDRVIKSLPIMKDLTNEYREQLKDDYLNKNIKSEKKFLEVTHAYFQDQSARVIKNVKAIKMSFDFDLEKETAEAISAFLPIYNRQAQKYNNVANQLSENDYKITDADYAEIKDRVNGFAKEINQTTKDDLTKILADAVQNGDSLGVVRQNIRELYDNYINAAGDNLSRSEMIARTEVNGVKNFMSRRNYSENPKVRAMEWLSTHDAFTRPEHSAADGQQVPRGARFNIGGEYLTYPGDPSGSAANVINCRCTVIPSMS